MLLLLSKVTIIVRIADGLWLMLVVMVSLCSSKMLQTMIGGIIVQIKVVKTMTVKESFSIVLIG